MPPERRDRATPLETATDVIENASLNHTDRSRTLKDALVEIDDVKDQLALFQLCVDYGYFEGVHLIASGLNAEDMKDNMNGEINFFVESPLFSEAQVVTLLRLFLTKGYSFGMTSRDATKDEEGSFAVFFTPSALFSSPMWPRFEEATSKIHLVQSIVHHNLCDALRLILPTLDHFRVEFAIVEAIGTNARACCDVLVNSDLESGMVEFALFMSAFYGRLDLLKFLWNHKLPISRHNSFRETAIVKSVVFSLVATENHELRILEAAVRRNHPHCVEVLLNLNAYPFNYSGSKNSPSQSKLIQHCIAMNFADCAKLLLGQCDAWAALTSALNSLLRQGLQSELILTACNSLKKALPPLDPAVDYQKYISERVVVWAEAGLNQGLLALLSKGDTRIFGTDDEEAIRTTVEKALRYLVNQGSSSANEAIKHLALLPLKKEKLNLIPTFEHCVFKSENVELVEWLLTLNDMQIFDAAHQLKSQVKNDGIKNLLENAKFEVKVEVKVEATDE